MYACNLYVVQSSYSKRRLCFCYCTLSEEKSLGLIGMRTIEKITKVKCTEVRSASRLQSFRG